MGDEGPDGHVFCGRHQDILRERDRCQCNGHAGRQARDARSRRRSRHPDPGSGQLVPDRRASRGSRYRRLLCRSYAKPRHIRTWDNKRYDREELPIALQDGSGPTLLLLLALSSLSL